MARESKPSGTSSRSTAPPSRGRSSRADPGTRARLGRKRAAEPPGRATKSKRASGRYTAPIPRKVKRSPRWYPWTILSLLVLGALAIILNYIDVLPASPTSWYVLGGMVGILAAAVMATRYR